MTRKLIRITTVPLALRYLLPGQMKFMKENGFEVIMISADGPERKAVIENEGCAHIVVPMTRKITPFQDLKCLFQLIRILKKEKPDIVHTHTPKAGLLGMLAAKYAGIKIRIHTVAGMPFLTRKGFKFYLLKYIEKLTYSKANYVWPNSNSLYHLILNKKLTSNKKLKVISKGSSNGIDLNRFNKKLLSEVELNEIKAIIKYNEQNFYLLFIGRLVKDKGIIELVNVFNKLHNKYEFLKLLLVGRYEADLDPLPENIITEIENNPAIIHTGWTEKPEYYLSLANCFVFPSHREGFPNVLLQAGAMELPIICSKISGNVDIVEDQKTGIFFQKEKEDELKAAIEFAINNLEKMKSMANELHQIINLNYSQEEVWKSILQEYKFLLSNG